VGRRHWAIALEDVQEVLARPAITPLPTAPAAVVGVCNRRGDVIPVVSVAVLAGDRPFPDDAEGRAPWVVVVETAEGPAGLAATDVPRTAELGPPVGPGEGPGALSVHRWEPAAAPIAVTLVDPAAFVTAARLAGEG
jgi:hypothetical protein